MDKLRCAANGCGEIIELGQQCVKVIGGYIKGMEYQQIYPEEKLVTTEDILGWARDAIEDGKGKPCAENGYRNYEVSITVDDAIDLLNDLGDITIITTMELQHSNWNAGKFVPHSIDTPFGHTVELAYHFPDCFTLVEAGMTAALTGAQIEELIAYHA
jgi:hypothetical protein